ncbi:MAG: RdgB/HAM1 family non-canonical purine NTP pyrophosphatase [candidate division Zixibacteria bacterium]|nr:RdgB/HAM1 family non-canonical purine NTP pyrophosphatase [candidate division Zixibacteria bacterium]
MRVVLATRNAAKLEEVAAIVGVDAEVLGLDAFGVVDLPAEDGATYEENALAKGRAVARALGLAALADDSGLEVAALGGAPGVRSSRYAGPACDPRANNEKLLRELAAVPPEKRQARFVCVAALVTPGGGEWLARGEVAGRIAAAPRGEGGFGYDPVFVPAAYERTFAEMTPEEKNRLSHRGRAFSEIKKYLRENSSL